MSLPMKAYEAAFDVGVKFGRNPDVDTGSTPEDLWEGGGEYTGQPDGFTPETVNVVSSSANDAAAGTGARTIRISGLKSDTSTAYETEDITMNGATPVTSISTWWRVNRAYVLTAGSSGWNEGTITINSTTTTANVFSEMPIGYAQTEIAAFTCPTGCNIWLKALHLGLTRSSGAAGSATVTLRARRPGSAWRAIRTFEVSTSSPVDLLYHFGGDMLPAGTDIKFRIESVSDNNSIFDGSFEYALVRA